MILLFALGVALAETPAEPTQNADIGTHAEGSSIVSRDQTGTVCVYRTSWFQWVRSWSIEIDEVPVASLRGHRFTCGAVPVGEHTMTIVRDGVESRVLGVSSAFVTVPFVVVPNETVHIRGALNARRYAIHAGQLLAKKGEGLKARLVDGSGDFAYRNAGQASPNLTVEQGYGTLCVVRPTKVLGSAWNFAVTSSAGRLGMLGAGHYRCDRVPAGSHTIAVDAVGLTTTTLAINGVTSIDNLQGSAQVQVSEGQTVHLRADLLWGPRVGLSVMKNDTARGLIPAMRLEEG